MSITFRDVTSLGGVVIGIFAVLLFPMTSHYFMDLSFWKLLIIICIISATSAILRRHTPVTKALFSDFIDGLANGVIWSWAVNRIYYSQDETVLSTILFIGCLAALIFKITSNTPYRIIFLAEIRKFSFLRLIKNQERMLLMFICCTLEITYLSFLATGLCMPIILQKIFSLIVWNIMAGVLLRWTWKKRLNIAL